MHPALSDKVWRREKSGMITGLTDTPAQLHGRTGQLVRFIWAAKPLASNRIPRPLVRLAKSLFRRAFQRPCHAQTPITPNRRAVVPPAYVVTYATGALCSRSPDIGIEEKIGIEENEEEQTGIEDSNSAGCRGHSRVWRDDSRATARSRPIHRRAGPGRTRRVSSQLRLVPCPGSLRTRRAATRRRELHDPMGR